MKTFGFIILAIGLGILIFVAIKYYEGQNTLKSPIPKEKGIKVIYITPAK